MAYIIICVKMCKEVCKSETTGSSFLISLLPLVALSPPLIAGQ